MVTTRSSIGRIESNNSSQFGSPPLHTNTGTCSRLQPETNSSSRGARSYRANKGIEQAPTSESCGTHRDNDKDNGTPSSGRSTRNRSKQATFTYENAGVSDKDTKTLLQDIEDSGGFWGDKDRNRLWRLSRILEKKKDIYGDTSLLEKYLEP